ncbi:hypothetical protein BU16DRAFT_562946 [Lophium mytilinum]|uniref:BTB domain-containing protein n=1 Tax=Lophium mytilinum TaxID=390894 RepID=A0A6A6QP34_9PEZI|nr:hypothetical protein BU16DRAFT_562946 [Lophium mytilinum]
MADDDFKMPTDLKECPHKTEFPPMTAWDHYVSVKVGKGEQKKEFNVYRGLLTYYSSYFAAALDGNFKEGVTQVVELKEDDPKVFEAFRSWMYTRRLLDQVPSFDVLKSAAHDRFLCNVFIFGDMRGIPGLKNEAIDQLHRSTAETWMVPSNDIKYIYTHTPVPSSLRDFVVSVHALTKNSVEEAESGKHGFTVDFLFDLLKMDSASTF